MKSRRICFVHCTHRLASAATREAEAKQCNLLWRFYFKQQEVAAFGMKAKVAAAK